MMQFHDQKEEQRVRDVAAYGTPPNFCSLCIYERETTPSRQQIGIELTWFRCGNIGRSSEAKEHQRKFGRKRRLVRRRERRSKEAGCSFINVHRIAGIYLSFLCFSPIKAGWELGISWLLYFWQNFLFLSFTQYQSPPHGLSVLTDGGFSIT